MVNKNEQTFPHEQTEKKSPKFTNEWIPCGMHFSDRKGFSGSCRTIEKDN
jgi:hypothetical protein